MAFLTLGVLLKTTSEEDALQLLIDNLDSIGFNATSWQVGSVQRTFLQMSARLWSNFTELTAAITSFAFNGTSVGEALTEFSDSNYDNQRVLATNTIGTLELTTIVGAGPYVVAVGQLVAQDTANGFTYRNTTGDTLTSGTTKPLVFEAEEAGAAKNVAIDTIVTLNTPLAGVSVNNPAIGVTGTWVTTAGIDLEADKDLKIRNTSRWSTLNIARPEDAYINIVRNSDPAITRATVDAANPRGPGTVDIYIAGTLGPVSATEQTTAQTAVDAVRPVTADPDVLLPPLAPLTYSATVFITAALDNAAERTAIEQSVKDYINGLDIGGENFGGGNVIPFAILSQTVTDFASVVNITWSSPTADIALAPNELATVTAVNFTYTQVT